MSPKGKPLSDDQYAAIAWADPSESAVALSRRLGVDVNTVRANRRRIARAGGWWCALVLLTCAECGMPLLTNANVRGHKLRHVGCQRLHLRRQMREYGRRQWQQRQSQRTFTAMQQVYERGLDTTGPHAFRDHVP